MCSKNKIQLELLRSDSLSENVFMLTFRADSIHAASARPGQFFNLRPLDSTAPLLPRPISVCETRPDKEEIDFLMRIHGEGTRLLSQRRPGALVEAIGPLGKPFEWTPGRPALLVAGGIGVAPLFNLARAMKTQPASGAPAPGPVTFCYGARKAADFLLLDKLRGVTDRLLLATEDGSAGAKGFVTELLEGELDSGAEIFVCGPPAMMQALLRSLRQRGLEGWFSLENQMGCGVGACMGCVVEGRGEMLRVCCDGPVFHSSRLGAIHGSGTPAELQGIQE